MRRDEVIDILGEPTAAGKFVDSPTITETLEYGAWTPGAEQYPKLWVHLGKAGVISVYSKRYIDWGREDEDGVYSRDEGGTNVGPLFEATLFVECIVLERPERFSSQVSARRVRSDR